MEYSNIPACAVNRFMGTVIVRTNMRESCCFSEKTLDSAAAQSPESHIVRCKYCIRNKLSRHYSDCVSDKDARMNTSKLTSQMKKHNQKASRSRHVEVCAKVCLVLLIGSLISQTWAAPAPHRGRGVMERQRRFSDTQEDPLWANPCDYTGPNTKSPATYSPRLAEAVSRQARSAAKNAAEYKDKFKDLHSFKSFDALLEFWKESQWLRKFDWFHKELLPREQLKILEEGNESDRMPTEDLDKITEDIDKFLPGMYKGLKMVVAGLNATEEALNQSIFTADESLKQKVVNTKHDVRGVLCLFYDIMLSKNLEIVPVLNSEIPDLLSGDKLGDSLLIYRDTMNYLEYLAQVFDRMTGKEALG